MENANGWIQLLGVVLGGTVLSTAISAIVQRKKVGADTDSTFVSTADQQRKGLVDDLTRTRTERDAEHERANRNDIKLRGWWARADLVMIWARRQDARNAERGIVDPMPQLYPSDGE
jgi:hypothetical protein